MDVVVSQLNSQDDSFCLAVVEYAGNLGAAYRAVWPDEPYPLAKAREKLARPEIAARVNQLAAIQDEHAGVSLGSHVAMLAHIRDLAVAKEQFKVALGAEVARAAAVGIGVVNKPKVVDGEEAKPAVQIFIGHTPANVHEWSAKHGRVAPIVIDNASSRDESHSAVNGVQGTTSKS